MERQILSYGWKNSIASLEDTQAISINLTTKYTFWARIPGMYPTDTTIHAMLFTQAVLVITQPWKQQMFVKI